LGADFGGGLPEGAPRLNESGAFFVFRLIKDYS
jgi:DnaJ-class molecular chaperone